MLCGLCGLFHDRSWLMAQFSRGVWLCHTPTYLDNTFQVTSSAGVSENATWVR